MQTVLTALTSGALCNEARHTPILRNATGWRRFWRQGLLVALGVLSAPMALAANTPLELDANLTQSACTILFILGPVGGNFPTNNISIPSADSAGLTNCGGGTNCTDTANAQPVTLELTGCGLGLNTTTPTVTVTGVNASSTDVPALKGSQLGYAFRDSGVDGGTSKGFYIVIGKKQAMTYSSTDLYTTASGGNTIALSGAGKGASGQDATSIIWPAVSCGPGCDDSRSRAGTLIARLVFQFAYK